MPNVSAKAGDSAHLTVVTTAHSEGVVLRAPWRGEAISIGQSRRRGPLDYNPFLLLRRLVRGCKLVGRVKGRNS